MRTIRKVLATLRGHNPFWFQDFLQSLKWTKMSDRPDNTIALEGLPFRCAEESGILRMLAYFDIFQYPLTKKEISQFLPEFFSEAKLEPVLQSMVTDKTIFLHNGFYSLHNNPLFAYRRKEGNTRARKLIPNAYAIGRFLHRFPFVRAVAVSGSLSKDFADEKADIDFFIITKANRLWIARTMMHLFKKLTFITGHQHYFCMNYFIDEEALLIQEKNIFTAIEIGTLLPVSGFGMLESFFEVNKWAFDFFNGPGKLHNCNGDKKDVNSWYKRFSEWIFTNGFGDRLDEWLMGVTTRRWQRKNSLGIRNKNGRTMNLITGRHFSRSNPGAFQEKVLFLYKQKLSDLKLSHP